MSTEHNTIDFVLYLMILLLCLVLVVFAFQNVIRERNVKSAYRKSAKHFTTLRWLILLCCVLQFFCFFGYFVRNAFIHQTAWNLWIIIGFFCLALLGIKTTKVFNEFQHIDSNASSINDTRTINTTHNKSSQIKFEQNNVFYIYVFWILSSLSQIIGTIVGWIITNIPFQFFCYGTWRFLTSISLIFTVFRIYFVHEIVKQSIYKYLIQPFSQFDNNEIKVLTTLYQSLKLLKKLIICFLILILVMIVNSMVEFIIFFQLLIDDELIDNYTFSQTPRYVIFTFYFPLWSFVQIINLFYTWIPYRQLNMNKYIINHHHRNDVRQLLLGNPNGAPKGAPKAFENENEYDYGYDYDDDKKNKLLAQLSQMKNTNGKNDNFSKFFPTLSPLPIDNNDRDDDGNVVHGTVVGKELPF